MEDIKIALGLVDPPEDAPMKEMNPNHKLTPEIRTWITFKCFDACIGDFDDKNLLQRERHCLKECSDHLKQQASCYRVSQQFRGFSEVDGPLLKPPEQGPQLKTFLSAQN